MAVPKRSLTSAVRTAAETMPLTDTLFTESQPGVEILERAGIPDIADRLLGKCCGGRQQRLRFALVLVPDPRRGVPPQAPVGQMCSALSPASEVTRARWCGQYLSM